MGENPEREQSDPLDESFREYRRLIIKEFEYLNKGQEKFEKSFDKLDLLLDELEEKMEKMQISITTLETNRNTAFAILGVLVPIVLGGIAKVAFGW